MGWAEREKAKLITAIGGRVPDAPPPPGGASGNNPGPDDDEFEDPNPGGKRARRYSARIRAAKTSKDAAETPAAKRAKLSHQEVCKEITVHTFLTIRNVNAFDLTQGKAVNGYDLDEVSDWARTSSNTLEV